MIRASSTQKRRAAEEATLQRGRRKSCSQPAASARSRASLERGRSFQQGGRQKSSSQPAASSRKQLSLERGRSFEHGGRQKSSSQPVTNSARTSSQASLETKRGFKRGRTTLEDMGVLPVGLLEELPEKQHVEDHFYVMEFRKSKQVFYKVGRTIDIRRRIFDIRTSLTQNGFVGWFVTLKRLEVKEGYIEPNVLARLRAIPGAMCDSFPRMGNVAGASDGKCHEITKIPYVQLSSIIAMAMTDKQEEKEVDEPPEAVVVPPTGAISAAAQHYVTTFFPAFAAAKLTSVTHRFAASRPAIHNEFHKFIIEKISAPEHRKIPGPKGLGRAVREHLSQLGDHAFVQGNTHLPVTGGSLDDSALPIRGYVRKEASDDSDAAKWLGFLDEDCPSYRVVKQEIEDDDGGVPLLAAPVEPGDSFETSEEFQPGPCYERWCKEQDNERSKYYKFSPGVWSAVGLSDCENSPTSVRPDKRESLGSPHWGCLDLTPLKAKDDEHAEAILPRPNWECLASPLNLLEHGSLPEARGSLPGGTQ